MTVPFFFNDTATTEIYTLSLHDALPIYEGALMRPAQTLGRLERGAAEVVPRGGQRASEGVEHEVRRLRHDRRGNVLQAEAEDEAGEAPRGGGRHAARSTGARGGKSSAPGVTGRAGGPTRSGAPRSGPAARPCGRGRSRKRSRCRRQSRRRARWLPGRPGPAIQRNN